MTWMGCREVELSFSREQCRGLQLQVVEAQQMGNMQWKMEEIPPQKSGNSHDLESFQGGFWISSIHSMGI